MHEFSSFLPAPPAVDSPVRFHPLKLAGRMIVACGWGIGAIAAGLLVLTGAVVAATVALGLGSARGVKRARERVAARRQTASPRSAELPPVVPKPDLG